MNKIVLVLVLCFFLSGCNKASKTENSTIIEDKNIEKASIKVNPDSSSNNIKTEELSEKTDSRVIFDIIPTNQLKTIDYTIYIDLLDKQSIEDFKNSIPLNFTANSIQYEKGFDWIYPNPTHQNFLCNSGCAPKSNTGLLINKSQISKSESNELPEETFGLCSTGNIIVKKGLDSSILAINNKGEIIWSIENSNTLDEDCGKKNFSTDYFIVKDGNIYLKSYKRLICARVDSFTIKWAINLDKEGITGDKISIYEDKLFVNFKTGLVCINTETGKALWKINDPLLNYEQEYFKALYHWCDDKHLYFVYKNNLHSANINNGKLEWSIAYNGKFIVQNNFLYMSNPGGVVEVEGSTGFSKPIYKGSLGDIALVSNNNILLTKLPSRNNNLKEAQICCIDKTGKLIWKNTVPNLIHEGSLMLEGNRLFVFTLDKILIYNIATGSKISDYYTFEKKNQIGIYYKCIVNGKLFIDNSFNLELENPNFLIIGDK